MKHSLRLDGAKAKVFNGTPLSEATSTLLSAKACDPETTELDTLHLWESLYIKVVNRVCDKGHLAAHSVLPISRFITHKSELEELKYMKKNDPEYDPPLLTEDSSQKNGGIQLAAGREFKME